VAARFGRDGGSVVITGRDPERVVMLASCSMGITATVVAKFVDRSIGRWPLRGSGLVAAAMVCLCCCLRTVQVRL
jgi:hypothetical protein